MPVFFTAESQVSPTCSWVELDKEARWEQRHLWGLELSQSLWAGKEEQIHGGLAGFGVGRIEVELWGSRGHSLLSLLSPTPGGLCSLMRCSQPFSDPVRVPAYPVLSLLTLLHVVCFSNLTALVPRVPFCFMLACLCFCLSSLTLPRFPGWVILVFLNIQLW